MTKTLGYSIVNKGDRDFEGFKYRSFDPSVTFYSNLQELLGVDNILPSSQLEYFRKEMDKNSLIRAPPLKWSENNGLGQVEKLIYLQTQLPRDLSKREEQGRVEELLLSHYSSWREERPNIKQPYVPLDLGDSLELM